MVPLTLRPYYHPKIYLEHVDSEAFRSNQDVDVRIPVLHFGVGQKLTIIQAYPTIRVCFKRIEYKVNAYLIELLRTFREDDDFSRILHGELLSNKKDFGQI